MIIGDHDCIVFLPQVTGRLSAELEIGPIMVSHVCCIWKDFLKLQKEIVQISYRGMNLCKRHEVSTRPWYSVYMKHNVKLLKQNHQNPMIPYKVQHDFALVNHLVGRLPIKVPVRQKCFLKCSFFALFRGKTLFFGTFISTLKSDRPFLAPFLALFSALFLEIFLEPFLKCSFLHFLEEKHFFWYFY